VENVVTAQPDDVPGIWQWHDLALGMVDLLHQLLLFVFIDEFVALFWGTQRNNTLRLLTPK
jgi:hypothetical protein